MSAIYDFANVKIQFVLVLVLVIVSVSEKYPPQTCITFRYTS